MSSEREAKLERRTGRHTNCVRSTSATVTRPEHRSCASSGRIVSTSGLHALASERRQPRVLASGEQPLVRARKSPYEGQKVTSKRSSHRRRLPHARHDPLKRAGHVRLPGATRDSGRDEAAS
eukprot:scaffold124569_cov27-Tisochrysis_lutea.AAC.3